MIGPGTSFPSLHIVPDSINAIAGVLTGTVADVQSWQDGNVLELAEVAATPGQNMEITFVDVVVFRHVVVAMYYQGSATHWVEVQLWDNIAAAWKKIHTFDSSMGLNYRYTDIPVLSADFISGAKEVKMRLYHPVAGNAAHDSFIDYAALVR